ncbi:hypothetical protein [Plantactinospora soyae]|uniref:Uncharacterized protein n=1 Tax=Plantactinospora soyae TaxID=1544732 RepID=A0A927MGB5_9ACTN|nr:hypothetical protein [Plantactinospora soyae]MBE1492561.1 hypothetical protein [Plantactinospora soyae]
MPDQRRTVSPAGPIRTVLGAVGLAVLLGGVFLLAPPLGTDLSAQVARANFFARHGFAPLDLGWYGGVSPYGYSLVTPPLMDWLGGDSLGPRLAGVLALLVSAAALALLLVRTAARRPLAGALVGAACIAGNLVSGRITYAVGVAFGLLALLALTTPRPVPRRLAAGTAALLAGAASPVAGLFVGLAGVALACKEGPLVIAFCRRRAPFSHLRHARRTVLDGAALALGAGVPVAGLGLVFGSGGWMNISLSDTVTAAVASALVAVLVSRRAVRIGAILATLGVLAAFAVRTPVGLNATRLAAMFALPVLVGYGALPVGLARRWSPRVAGAALAGALVLVTVVEPPVLVADLRAAGDPTASRSYFQPLMAELARRPPGRIEVVPTANYWEAAYLPEAAPLARGWLRQVDQAYNRLFLDGSVDADSYGRWLRDNGVGYVALADAKPSWVGRREAELIRAGLPYLTPIWQHRDWTLYAVTGAPSIVESIRSGATPGGGDLPDESGGPGPGAERGGAELVRATSAELTIDVPAGGEILVRLRWSRWLRVTGPFGPDGVPVRPTDPTATVLPACLAPYGDWTVLRVPQPGRYRITGSLTAAAPRCAD